MPADTTSNDLFEVFGPYGVTTVVLNVWGTDAIVVLKDVSAINIEHGTKINGINEVLFFFFANGNLKFCYSTVSLRWLRKFSTNIEKKWDILVKIIELLLHRNEVVMKIRSNIIYRIALILTKYLVLNLNTYG